MEEERGVSFGPYRLVGLHGPFIRYSHEVSLPPKALAVLWHLVNRAGAVVTKEELLSTVWAGTVVGEEALTSCLRRLRRALQDDAEHPRYIATVHRIGYRFIGQVVSRHPAVVRRKPTTSSSRESQAQNPSFLSQPSELSKPHALLVGRDAELSQLHHVFEQALRGQRQMVFVTGEAGIGKTALVEAFLQRLESRVQSSEERQKAKDKKQKAKSATAPRSLTPDRLAPDARFPLPDPWVAWGQCIEHYGAGEAYLPVLETVGRLCRAGGEEVVALLRQHAPTWLLQLPTLLSEADAVVLQSRIVGATRERMLREITEALEAISVVRPIVLVLEDLQWSDASTVEVLNMLARRREAARILVVGTVRPVELIVNTHPLKQVKQDMVTRGLAVEIALPYLHSDAVQAYVAQQTDALGDDASEVGSLLYERTEGHPLFMVQLLADLKRQAIPLAEARQLLPPGLQQLLSAQIERLTPAEQAVLEAASVVGAEFSVTSVAAGVERTVEEIETLCEHLARQGQFIAERELGQWPDGAVSGRYGFRHALYQEVLYQRLSASRRARLHRQIGLREETAYGERAREIAAQLALHFERGHDDDRAVRYLQQAGENAMRRNAPQEAASLFAHGVILLQTLPDRPERLPRELALQMALGVALRITKGFAAVEVGEAYARALELCQHLGDSPHLVPVLRGLWSFYNARAELPTARALAEQLLRLTTEEPEALPRSAAHMALGLGAYASGDLPLAQAQLERGLTLFDPQQLRSPAMLAYGSHPGLTCLFYLPLVLWSRGYPEQALQMSMEGLRLAEQFSSPPMQAFASVPAAILRQLRQEADAVRALAESAIAHCQEHGFREHLLMDLIIHGWALTAQGDGETGLATIRQSLQAYLETGAGLIRPYFLTLLAEAYGMIGQPQEGIRVLEEALAVMDENGERVGEAESYRLKGELTLQSSVQRPESGVKRAEDCFLKAINIARNQQAKSLELRASTSLARLLLQQGKRAKAHKLLSTVYNWFTEGFDTKDLQEAKALLDDLATPAPFMQ